MVDPVEPDRIDGAPHPRATLRLFGQQAAERTFLDAWSQGRLHHGWLITGPRGVGKATLAWRIARFLRAGGGEGGLFGPPDSLDIDEGHPVAHLVAAGADPGILPLIRTPDDKTGKLRSQIVIDDVRRLREFFGLSATEGGWRVVIADSVDEMNPNAANALLKSLEEPPKRAMLLLVSHQPSKLLPTIRSRCRELRLAPLGPADMDQALHQAVGATADGPALAALSGGSVGEAIRLTSGGVALYAEIVEILSALPRLSRPQVLKLCNSVGGRDTEARFDLIVRLVDLLLARLAKAGAMGASTEIVRGEGALLARLSPDARAARHWADLAADLGNRTRAARAVNLDPGSLVLDMFLRLESASRSATG